MIVAENLAKHFKVHERPPGLCGRDEVAGLKREYKTVKAVDGVSFSIERGERVGFLGPERRREDDDVEGALAGLLHPTSGTVRGRGPSRRSSARGRRFSSAITLVMGQKSQLIWDLPALRDVRDEPRDLSTCRRPQFATDACPSSPICSISARSIMEKPTRQLSLGERMKCELAAALLHRPTTLCSSTSRRSGWTSRCSSRSDEFVRDYNQKHEATVMLTSHYMDDVVALCPRIIVIDQGVIIHDGDLRQMIKTLDPTSASRSPSTRAPTSPRSAS